MDINKCGFQSPTKLRFCGECGLEKIPSLDLRSENIFREEHIAQIEPNIPPLARIIEAQMGKGENKEREATIMFCGPTGQTPELGYVKTCIVCIVIHNVHRWEGLRSPTSENGILAVFGAVDELEDATQRAVNASIAIHKDIAKFRGQIKHDPQIPLLRIGIYTGTVKIAVNINPAEVYQVQLDESNETITMAYRLKAVAEPGTTYIAEETQRLTRRLFSFQRMDGKKGPRKEQPISFYKVLSAKKDLSSYQSCKGRMQTGDLLQWKNRFWSFWGPLWWLWRTFTGSKVDHSSMVLQLKEYAQLPTKRFTTESRLFSGTALNRLSHRLKDFPGEVRWYPLKAEYGDYRQELGESMLARIGISYDLFRVIRITLSRAFGYSCRIVGIKRGSEILKRWKGRHEEDRVFCSEYCFWVYEECLGKKGINLSELPLPSEIRKLDIFRNEKNGGKQIL